MHAVATAPPRVRPWLVLAAWAGFRACEVAKLRRENVLDTAAPPVLLVASDATKGTRERIVPMSVFVLAELRVAGLPHNGWVFRRHDGRHGPNAPWTVSHLANSHLADCGADATLHQLRHRFGSSLYKETQGSQIGTGSARPPVAGDDGGLCGVGSAGRGCRGGAARGAAAGSAHWTTWGNCEHRRAETGRPGTRVHGIGLRS